MNTGRFAKRESRRAARALEHQQKIQGRKMAEEFKKIWDKKVPEDVKAKLLINKKLKEKENERASHVDGKQSS